MAGYQISISLAALCLWLCHDSLARNDAPCQRGKWNNAYSTFLKRHVREGTPSGVDQNEWMRFIKNFGCDRPTQSFLDPDDLARVQAVCSDQGGQRFKDSLCISRMPFTFTTVRSETNTCGIRSVTRETKHLILACEALENQCLPVHFEGNPSNSKPDNNAKGCQGGQKGAAAGLRASWLWLLLASALLLLVCSQ